MEDYSFVRCVYVKLLVNIGERIYTGCLFGETGEKHSTIYCLGTATTV